MPRAFHLMAKPTSFHCNLNCDYCFYLEKESIMPSRTRGKPSYTMSDDVLQSYIKNYITSQPTAEVEFTWQGGEPTMAGLAFFEKVIAYQARYAKGKTIRNSIQTNGLLLDDKWCRFLKQHHFLVGLSIDGPEDLHNAYRTTNTGQPTYKAVMRTVERLRNYDIPFNTLTVVNNINVHQPEQVYAFLKSIGSNFQQYIPVIESRAYQGVGNIRTVTIGEKTDSLLPFSVDAESYGNFMTAIFDKWVGHDVGKVFIQMFESALSAWAGYEPSLCIFRKSCGDALVIEQNGDIYSCDHYVYQDHKIGNVLNDKLIKVFESKKQRRFAQDKATLSLSCMDCQYRFACNGGCPKHRLTMTDSGIPHNVLCSGYKKFFAHVDPYMRFMAKEIMQGRSAANIMPIAHQLR